MRQLAGLAAATLMVVGCAHAHEADAAAGAKPDRLITVSASEHEHLLKAIEPYVQKARKSYPAAKARFLAGLPTDQVFYVTTRIVDDEGRIEQVFIEVAAIENAEIIGTIGSHIGIVRGYAEGDGYRLQESELIDWTIVMPDGSEEGNFVGNFLDTYVPKPTNP